MDPRPLATIVSPLGIATFASCLLQLAASRVAGHSPDPSRLRRIAGSRYWSATASMIMVAWLTAPGIELRLVGVTARNVPVVTIETILVLSFLVCWLIDVARGRAGK
jgi:hypothetical protein